jgi:hypothetical protein
VRDQADWPTHALSKPHLTALVAQNDISPWNSREGFATGSRSHR